MGNPILLGYSDANFAQDIDIRRSISGFIFMLAGAPIKWQRNANAVVAASSTEAEYITFVRAVEVLCKFKFGVHSLVFAHETIHEQVSWESNIS